MYIIHTQKACAYRRHLMLQDLEAKEDQDVNRNVVRYSPREPDTYTRLLGIVPARPKTVHNV